MKARQQCSLARDAGGVTPPAGSATSAGGRCVAARGRAYAELACFGALPPGRALVLCCVAVVGCAPRGTAWTIQCLELRGPQHKEHIKQIAETLKRTPGIRPHDVFTRDGPDECSRLYYGTYYRSIDKKSGRRAIPKQMRSDLELVKQLGAGPGEYYFLHARKVRMPTPDVGNPEWALSSVDGVYTLQVAAFEPTDDFWEYKQAAADYCELLRAKGYEAYYYHSPTKAVSMVTVGLFGREAVRTSGDGRTYYSQDVIELQERDELLKYNWLNGGIYRVKNTKGVMVPVPSRLVRLPQADESIEW